MCREAAEHDRVDGAEARAGEHRDHRLRHHGHVDHHPITNGDPEALQRAREDGDGIAQLAVGVARDRTGDRTVVDERQLVGADPIDAVAAVDPAVERVEAGVQHAAGEPAVEGRVGIVADPRGRALPVQGARRLAPKPFRIFETAAIKVVELAHAVGARLLTMSDRCQSGKRVTALVVGRFDHGTSIRSIRRQDAGGSLMRVAGVEAGLACSFALSSDIDRWGEAMSDRLLLGIGRRMIPIPRIVWQRLIKTNARKTRATARVHVRGPSPRA